MPKGFSASTVKSWFQYRCERKVRYELSTDAELEAVPVVRELRRPAWAVLGDDYEERVVNRLRTRARVLAPDHGYPVLSEGATLAFLQGRGDVEFAAQANLRPGAPRFLDGTGLRLNRNFVDLLRRNAPATPGCSGSLTIIDVKATRRATAFHKAQVAFYARVVDFH